MAHQPPVADLRPTLARDADFILFGQQVAGLLDACHDGRITDAEALVLIRQLGYIRDDWREPWGVGSA